MSNFLDTDSSPMILMDKLKDMILLNLIWLLFCLPVVTIGPANTALYCVARKMARGDWPKVWKTFTEEFKACFRKSFLLWLCLLPPAALLLFYLIMTLSGSVRGTLLLTILFWIAGLLLGFICSYAWPLTAYFENSVGQTLKNAMLLPLMNPLIAIAVTFLNLLPLLLYLYFTALFVRICVYWLLLGFAVTAFLNCRLLAPFFIQFIPDEDDTEEG